MPETVFSTARLRGYRVIEEAGLGSAADLQILATVVAARLWVPLALIEVAFRNAADILVTANHSRGASWLFAEDLPADASFKAARVRGAEALTTEGGGLADPDPVQTAAVMAGQFGRPTITRDDVVAHLMLGFWVVRAPEGLAAQETPILLFDLVAAHFDQKLGDGESLKVLMQTDISLTRNRVAHHEPVLIRAKHVFTKGEAKIGNELVTSLQGALDKFERLKESIIKTAKVMAPMAAEVLDQVAEQLTRDLEPLREQLRIKREEFDALREERKAERRAKFEAAQGDKT